MNVEPAPVSFTDTLGFTVAVEVEVATLAEVEVETDVLVMVEVTVLAEPVESTYAPPAATTATTDDVHDHRGSYCFTTVEFHLQTGNLFSADIWRAELFYCSI